MAHPRLAVEIYTSMAVQLTLTTWHSPMKEVLFQYLSGIPAKSKEKKLIEIAHLNDVHNITVLVRHKKNAHTKTVSQNSISMHYLISRAIQMVLKVNIWSSLFANVPVYWYQE